MRALSQWQPWASLWCSPLKVHETRDWQLHHRGWLLVHAAKRPIGIIDADLDELCRKAFGSMWRGVLPRGAIVGAVRVLDVRATSVIESDSNFRYGPSKPVDLLCGNFAPGRYGFRRSEFKRFKTPIPYRGQQGPFNVPDDLVAAAMEA